MKIAALIALVAACGSAATAIGQPAPPAAGPPRGPPAGSPEAAFMRAYPQREVDPAAAARGSALYTNNNCKFCHGADIRGGDGGGPSLQRSAAVLNDVKGEKIGPIIKAGVGNMPAFPNLTDAQIGDIAEFLHSFRVASRGGEVKPPPSIVVGNPAAGRAYFAANCASCHSASGDLAKIGSKYADPRVLQQRWMAPAASKPTVATVTLADRSTVVGAPTAIDEFSITLKLADGSTRTIVRDGDTPRVAIDNPRQAHADLLRKYSDTNIHDVTAYLVTLK